jgi:hypothetical protein
MSKKDDSAVGLTLAISNLLVLLTGNSVMWYAVMAADVCFAGVLFYMAIEKAFELSNRLTDRETCVRCGRDRYDIDIVSGMCEDCQREVRA